MNLKEIRTSMLNILRKAQAEERRLSDEEQKKFDELRGLKQQEKELRALEGEEDEEKVEEPADEEKVEETEKASEETPDEEPKTEEKADEETEEPAEEAPKAEEAPAEENEEEKRKKLVNHNRKSKMEQRFSLLGAIRDEIAHKEHTGKNAEVIERGREQFKKAGVGYESSIVLPTRRSITAGGTNSGKEAIATDTLDIVAPLYTQSAFAGLGATMLDDLVGNVEIPVLGAGSANWKAETAAAGDAAPSTSAATLTPKRLTAFIDVSKLFLQQDSVGAEAMLLNDLQRAILDKLEQTVFGAAAANNSPKGMFNGVTAETLDMTYAGIVDIIADMEQANVYNGKWLMNPLAKASLAKVGVKGTGDTASLGFVFSNNEVLGMPAVTSGNVASKGLAYGNWEDLVIGNWGGIEITVDPYSQAANGCVRIIANSYWDADVRRAGTITKKILK